MSNKLTRNQAGSCLFFTSIVVGAITLELIHRSAPQALNFSGDYRAVFILTGISLAMFLIACVAYQPERQEEADPDSFYRLGPVEMRASCSAPGSHYLGDDAFSGHFVKRDGQWIPIVFYAEHDNDGDYEVKDEATLLVSTRVAGCVFPKDSVIHLTKDEVKRFQNGDAVLDSMVAYADGDDHERNVRNETGR